MKEVSHWRYNIRLYNTLDELNNDFIYSFLLEDKMYLIKLKSNVKRVTGREMGKFINSYDLEERKRIYKDIVGDYKYILVYGKRKDNSDDTNCV